MLLQIMMAAGIEGLGIDCRDSEVVQIHYKKMAKYAIHKVKCMVGRDDVAAEIVQDVFLKLWQKKPFFDHEKALYAWVYKASHRAALDYMKSAKVKKEDLNMEIVSSSISLHEKDLVLQKSLIQSCLLVLNNRQAEIFSYYVFDGMNYEEISELLGVSTKTIQRDWNKIKKKLEKIIEVSDG